MQSEEEHDDDVPVNSTAAAAVSAPQSLSAWLALFELHLADPLAERIQLYQAATQQLPYSYKIWLHYLQNVQRSAMHFPLDADIHNQLLAVYESALSSTMQRYPHLWSCYIQHAVHMRRYTLVRQLVGRALQALPVTQHDAHVWALILQLIGSQHDIAMHQPSTPADVAQAVSNTRCMLPLPTALSLYRRYLQLQPARIEFYIEWLLENEQYSFAAAELAHIVTNAGYSSARGKTSYELWQSFLTIATEHARSIDNQVVDIAATIRQGIAQHTADAAQWWCQLADYHIQRAEFSEASAVYDTALTTVTSVQDFGVVYNSYTEFLESMAEVHMAALEESGEGDADDADSQLNAALQQLDTLVTERPFMLANVLIRHSPHDVDQRLKRIALFMQHKPSDVNAQLVEYATAIREVDAQQATGKLHLLWINFARLYEHHNDVENARQVFQRAVAVPYRSVESLATLYCEYVEFELRHSGVAPAYHILKQALVVPRWAYKHRHDTTSLPNTKTKQSAPSAAGSGVLDIQSSSVHKRLYTSVRLWQLHIDLEMHCGTFDSLKALHRLLFDIHVITPAMVLTYAHYLHSHRYYEESFRLFEQAITLFPHPHSFILWKAYLHQFLQRYASTKIERCRDLFEHSLVGARRDDTLLPLYLLYANYEEQHGLTRRAMQIYERACKAVSSPVKLELYLIYIARVIVHFGVSRARSIYEQALKAVADQHVPQLAQRYASMEARVGEIDRSRAIYLYAAQYSDPRVHATFWQQWNDFEVRHGNAETFKEMLRSKRTTQAMYAHITIPTAIEPGRTNGTMIQFVASAHKLPSSQEADASQQAQLPAADKPEAPQPPMPVDANPDTTDMNRSALSIETKTVVNDEEIDVDG